MLNVDIWYFLKPYHHSILKDNEVSSFILIILILYARTWNSIIGIAIVKVRTFWEAHKIFHNLPHVLYIYFVNIQTMRKIFSNFVCFSESLNFNLLV